MMEYYSGIKRNNLGSFVVMWMKADSVIQSEVSQKEKNKYHVLTHAYGSSLASLPPQRITECLLSVLAQALWLWAFHDEDRALAGLGLVFLWGKQKTNK